MIDLFREAPFLIPLAFIGVVIFLLIVIWSIRRHLDPTLHVESTASIDELMTSMAGLTLTTAVWRLQRARFWLKTDRSCLWGSIGAAARWCFH